MILRALAGAVAVFAALAVGSARARADVVPDHSRWKPKPCTAPGQPCITGPEDDPEGPPESKEGTCVAATCTVQVRNHRDGVTTPVTMNCFRCVAGAKGSKSRPTSKSSGCAVAPERGGAGSLALTVSLIAGLILLAARRANPKED